MQLTLTAGYALQALVSLANQSNGDHVPVERTAAAQGLPAHYLKYTFRPLVKAGLLDVMTSAIGGYRLAKSPDKITLLEVVEAVQGPLYKPALHFPTKHADGLNERVDAVCQRVANAVRRQLAKITLADLVESDKGKEPG